MFQYDTYGWFGNHSESHSIPQFGKSSDGLWAEANPHVLKSSFGSFPNLGDPRRVFILDPPMTYEHLWYPPVDKLINHFLTIMDTSSSTTVTKPEFYWDCDGPSCLSKQTFTYLPLPPAFQKGSGLRSQSWGHLTDGAWHFFGAFSPTCYQYSGVIYHILRYWLYLWWGIIIDHHRSSGMNGSIYQPLTARNAIQPTNLRASGICLSCDAHQWISFKTIVTGKPPIFPCHGKIPGFRLRFSPKPTGNPWVPDTMTLSFIGSCWP